MDAAVQKRVTEATEADSSGGIAGEEQFNKLAEQYGIENDIVKGQKNDEDNAKKLYKAVIGAEAGDGMSVEDMLKAVYAADETNKLAMQMEEYGRILAKTND